MASESLLETLYEEETLDDLDLDLDLEEDEEMIDAETLEHVPADKIHPVESTKSTDGDDKAPHRESKILTSRGKKAKKKKKKNKPSPGTNSITDINRFVTDTCRNLREKKPYLVWNAVGCLGLSALRDLIKEVDAIQDCGGQLTADGQRFRTGGGILWNILKTREPKAYNEIMAKGKEFEKQFRQGPIRQARNGKGETSSHRVSQTSHGTKDNVLNALEVAPEVEKEAVQKDSAGGRLSVLNRIRVPVTYDDLL